MRSQQPVCLGTTTTSRNWKQEESDYCWLRSRIQKPKRLSMIGIMTCWPKYFQGKLLGYSTAHRIYQPKAFCRDHRWHDGFNSTCDLDSEKKCEGVEQLFTRSANQVAGKVKTRAISLMGLHDSLGYIRYNDDLRFGAGGEFSVHGLA